LRSHATTPTRGRALGGSHGASDPCGGNRAQLDHEYRPTTTAINNGNPSRIRVPTALERAGDFSQTLVNNGALFNTIKDPSSSLPCTSTNTSGCFQDSGVLGRIPASSLYAPGIAVLSQYPVPNVGQNARSNYNYEIQAPTVDNLTQQPAIRRHWRPGDAEPSDTDQVPVLRLRYPSPVPEAYQRSPPALNSRVTICLHLFTGILRPACVPKCDTRLAQRLRSATSCCAVRIDYEKSLTPDWQRA
jgi:hypothetical protein